MAQRDDIFIKFGPKLLEGFLEMIFNENNILRTASGLPPRTKQQIYDEIMNHVTTLPDYDWTEDRG